jgi:hypothetical protein
LEEEEEEEEEKNRYPSMHAKPLLPFSLSFQLIKISFITLLLHMSHNEIGYRLIQDCAD